MKPIQPERKANPPQTFRVHYTERHTMYVKAQIVRVAATADTCTCSMGMGTTTTCNGLVVSSGC